MLGLTLYLRFGATLSDQARQLLILRTAWLRRARYELTRHARLARRLGVTEYELVRVAAGSAAPEWDPVEALLVRAAEELCRDTCVGDETLAGLTEHFSPESSSTSSSPSAATR